MNHYLFLTVKEKATNFIRIVIQVDEMMGLAVEFPKGVKWLKENEIEINKASGKRIKIIKDNYTTEKPCCNFTSIVILRNEEVEK